MPLTHGIRLHPYFFVEARRLFRFSAHALQRLEQGPLGLHSPILSICRIWFYFVIYPRTTIFVYDAHLQTKDTRSVEGYGGWYPLWLHVPHIRLTACRRKLHECDADIPTSLADEPLSVLGVHGMKTVAWESRD